MIAMLNLLQTDFNVFVRAQGKVCLFDVFCTFFIVISKLSSNQLERVCMCTEKDTFFDVMIIVSNLYHGQPKIHVRGNTKRFKGQGNLLYQEAI